MTTKITDANIEATGVGAGSYTAADITVNSSGQVISATSNSVVVSGGGGGPKITGVAVTDSSWTVLDDTAVNVSGGYIKITGSGFSSGCQVVVGTLVATSVSFVSSTEVRVQVPAQPAGTYTVYLTNSDGGVAIRVNGINYSSTPTWTTTSPLPGGAKDAAISIQLAASSNSTIAYSLASGSTLPSGLTLSGSGLLSGTVTGITVETTYNFTVVATDQENQDTPQAFQITITVNDPYYRLVTLHLPGTGTNLAANNTFLDSSTNNFTITRNGNTTQGTFSPFSQTGWGNYFDGSGDCLSIPTSAISAVGSNNFSMECWVYPLRQTNTYSQGLISYGVSGSVSGTSYIFLELSSSGYAAVGYAQSGSYTITSSTITPINQWSHIVVCRSGSTLSIFLNGTRVATTSTSATVGSSGNVLFIGSSWYANEAARNLQGYISNARIVNGASAYDATQSTITVPTSPLTAISSTSLLTCQSNRFVDNSASPLTITVNGNTSVQAFSPFNPSASWSAATYGGSGYFDGSGDYLSAASNTAFNCGTDNFTVEVWVYITTRTLNYPAIISNNNGGFSAGAIAFTNSNSNGALDKFVLSVYDYGGAGRPLEASSTNDKNTWYHVAIVRDSSTTLKMYRNGLQVASQTISSGLTFDWGKSGLLVGGGNWDGANSYFNGYIQGLRLVKGTAVYTGEFTPPTKPLAISGADSAGSYPSTTNVNTSFASSATSLLLNYTNAGIYDATSKNDLETVGDAQLSNTTAKWGSTSIKFDGTGDYLTSNPATTDMYAFGSGDFTIEFWMYISVLGTSVPYDQRTTGGNGATSTLYITSSTLRYYVSGSDRITSSTLSTGQWYHVAVARSGTSTKMFIDGTQAGSTYTDSTVYTNSSLRPFIGGDSNNPGANGFNGYVQDLRITKGLARYTANFTPPTAAFPTL